MKTQSSLGTNSCAKSILVASLNFSGINTNPFEYDDGSQLIASLNHYCQQIMKIQLPNLQKWIGSKLDKMYKQNRQTICFGEAIELQDKKLPNRQQFIKIWRKKYDQVKKDGTLKYEAKEEEVQNLIIMDFVFYRAAIMHIYSIKSVYELEGRLKQLDPSKLLNFLEHQKSRPACQLKLKRAMAEKYYKDLDLFCLQQGTSVQWYDLMPKEYLIAGSDESLIIYKPSVFGKKNEELTQKYRQLLNFNNDTVSLFTKGGYLIISSHLSSSSQKHKQQAKNMFSAIQRVLDSNEDLKVIICIDANHYIQNSTILEKIKLKSVPDNQKMATSIKKRSFLQAQLNKAGLSIFEVKDHVITNLKIMNYQTELINGQKSNQQLLPNDIHPYDHFALKVELGINTLKEKIEHYFVEQVNEVKQKSGSGKLL